MRRSRISAVVFLTSFGAALASAQDPPASPGPAGPTFRTGVNVVRVDVIVTDSSGKPVTDLSKEEFEIVEDGRPQAIDLFRQIRIDAAVTDADRPRQVLDRDTEEREASRDDVRIFAILLADYQVCSERSRLVRVAALFARNTGLPGRPILEASSVCRLPTPPRRASINSLQGPPTSTSA